MEDPKMATMRTVLTYNSSVYAVLVYDWLICFKEEYTWIWKVRPSLVSGIYVILRYYTFVKCATSLYLVSTNMTQPQCLKWTHYQVLGNLPIIFSVGSLLTLRLYALYERNNYLLAGLAACIVAIMAIIGVSAKEFGAPAYIGGSGPCFASAMPGASNLRISLWLAPFCFDLLCTILLVVRVLIIRRRGAAHNNVLTVLMRDGLIYFAGISAVNLINVGFQLGAPERYKTINATMSFMVSALAGCRLILSLRGAVQHDLSTGAISQSFAQGATTHNGKAVQFNGQKSNGRVQITHRPEHDLAVGIGATEQSIALESFTAGAVYGNRENKELFNDGASSILDHDVESGANGNARLTGGVQGIYVVTEKETRIEGSNV